MAKLVSALSLLKLAASFQAPNPSHKYYCPYPDEHFPGSGWENISTRAESAEYIIYAKAIDKFNEEHSLQGATYDVEWSLECQPMKKPATMGVFPQTFSMTDLGRFGADIIYCGPRNIVTGFNYVFFGKNFNDTSGYLELDEVNNQEGLFRLSEDNDARIQLADWMYGCIADHCHDDTDKASDDWAPMTLENRVNAAEYAVEVHMKTETEGCVQCVLQQPDSEDAIEHVYAQNETITINFADASGSCHNYNVQAGKRYIMLLQRRDINDVILPSGTLMVDEVNGQTAIIEVDNQTQNELADLLQSCPAQDYTCPTESTDSGAARPWGFGASIMAMAVCAAVL